MTIWTFPSELERFTSISFSLNHITSASPMSYLGATAATKPFAQFWSAKLTLTQMQWDDGGQEAAAFFERLAGRGGVLRMGDPMRRIPLRDRLIMADKEQFSDGTWFSDASGFVDGLLPDFVTLDQAASKGATYIVLRGLPASETKLLRRGDLIEIRPNGIPVEGPSLHSVHSIGNSDASGKSGIEISPPLRRGFAAGDMVVLKNATSVFHVTDDQQGMPEVSIPSMTAIGFNLIEALDLI